MPPKPPTPSVLTNAAVEAALSYYRPNRQIEYLCRAYLQFDADAMSPKDLETLTRLVADRTKP
jgi:hypothetical protein